MSDRLLEADRQIHYLRQTLAEIPMGDARKAGLVPIWEAIEAYYAWEVESAAPPGTANWSELGNR